MEGMTCTSLKTVKIERKWKCNLKKADEQVLYSTLVHPAGLLEICIVTNQILELFTKPGFLCHSVCKNN